MKDAGRTEGNKNKRKRLDVIKCRTHKQNNHHYHNYMIRAQHITLFIKYSDFHNIPQEILVS